MPAGSAGNKRVAPPKPSASLKPEVRIAIAEKSVVIVTSQRTRQLQFVNAVIDAMRKRYGIPADCVFTQQDIDKAATTMHW